MWEWGGVLWGCPEVARRASVGAGEERSLSYFCLKIHKTCYIHADTRREGQEGATLVRRDSQPQPQPQPQPGSRPRVGRGQVGQTDGQTQTQALRGLLRAEGRSHVWGDGVEGQPWFWGAGRDKERIVLLVGGRSGPLRLWLILLIFLLHQRVGGGVEKSKWEEGLGTKRPNPGHQIPTP